MLLYLLCMCLIVAMPMHCKQFEPTSGVQTV